MKSSTCLPINPNKICVIVPYQLLPWGDVKMEPVTINFCISQVKFFRNYLQFLLTMGLMVPCGCFRKAKEKMPGWSLKLKQELIKGQQSVSRNKSATAGCIYILHSGEYLSIFGDRLVVPLTWKTTVCSLLKRYPSHLWKSKPKKYNTLYYGLCGKRY